MAITNDDLAGSKIKVAVVVDAASSGRMDLAKLDQEYAAPEEDIT